MATASQKRSTLQHKLATAQADLKLKEQEFDRNQEVVVKAESTKRTLYDELITLKMRVSQAHERILIHRGISEIIAEMRNNIIARIKESTRTDITIAHKQSLDRELVGLKKHLAATCSHPFILTYDGHAGFQSEDYQDAYPGERVCIVCGYTEDSVSCKLVEFKVLTDSPLRVLKRDWQKKAGDVWQPLSAFLPTFEKSAGHMNLDW